MQSRLWTPTKDLLKNSQMARFMAFVNNHADTNLNNYDELYQFSINDPEQFWLFVAQYCEIIFAKQPTKILAPAKKMMDTRWFIDAKLNFAENLLRHKDTDKKAIVFVNENGDTNELTFTELYSQVEALSSNMRKLGIKKGDRVAGYLPNRPETIIAMLATASIGAIWTSCSLDFGYHGVYDRLSQIKPKLLFTADGHYYNGTWFTSSDVVKKLHHNLPSIEKIILINNSSKKINLNEFLHCTLYEDFLDNTPNPLTFTQTSFQDPLYILFSSGTTGRPKCIVHSAGGTLIQHLKELVLHTDLTQDDVIFYYTTCGWMMWNWLVTSLAVGATLVLYDGSPLFPKAQRLMNLIDDTGITVFGTSAKYITAIEKAKLQPKKTHNLSTVKTILSTGSPLLPKNYDYIYNNVKPDVRLCSISGGTDIVSCFALGNPILPIYSGELQCRGLGMSVNVFDEEGNSMNNEKGELVCTAPFPSMPIYFWNDPDQEKYKKAYFKKYPNVWAHGDFAKITEHGGLIIYGRSDTVLNPGGVRIGTAEIYREVEQFDDIKESIAIGKPNKDDVKVMLYVVMQPNAQLSDELIKHIKESIKTHVSPHHVPAEIIAVPDIPRTVSGKIVELAVRNVVMGKPVENIDAIVNPESLKYFRGQDIN